MKNDDDDVMILLKNYLLSFAVKTEMDVFGLCVQIYMKNIDTI